MEFRRYVHRFVLKFTRIETLAGVNRTVFNQYDSLVRPLEPNVNFKDAWLRIEGEVKEDRIMFSWDGMYRGADFPDKKYFYEVHVRWNVADQCDGRLV